MESRSRLFKLALGWSLLILGFIGFLLPLLQGTLLTVAGLMVLSTVSPLADRILTKVTAWVPDPVMDRAEAMRERYIGTPAAPEDAGEP